MRSSASAAKYDTKLIQELRRRKHFTKPSITRRTEMLKAVYIEQKNG